MRSTWALPAVLGAAVVCGLAATSSAAALPSGCTESGQTATCVYTSGSNPLTVPAGVSSIHVVAVGGTGSGVGGGHGAVVSGDLGVTSGGTLYAVVAANGGGHMVGGAEGGAGGSGDSFCFYGPGGLPFCISGDAGSDGGGASDIRASQGDLSSRLLVAAGGGGAGGGGAGLFGGGGGGGGGGAGGGGAGGEGGGFGGGGGSGAGAGGGNGGAGACINEAFCLDGGSAGGAGPGGHGGNGRAFTATPTSASAGGGGGGGGGGLFGGGGGGGGYGGGGGGGGGGNLVPPGGSASIDATGIPMVQISFVMPPTSRAQCKHGGWHDFPQFKSQGDCVSFVATHGRNAP